MRELYELKLCVGWEDPDYELCQKYPVGRDCYPALGQVKAQVWFDLFGVRC